MYAAASGRSCRRADGHFQSLGSRHYCKMGRRRLHRGLPDGTFKPDNSITRAEFVTLVNKAFNMTAKAEIDFTDVPAGAWYYGEVAKAKAAGYIGGYPDNTMRPDNPISRQELQLSCLNLKA